MAEVVKPAFAGSFYPSAPDILEAEIHELLNNDCSPSPEAVGMVVPHAGYLYSGRTAGYGFASAPGNISTIVICAPSHRYPFKGETVFDIDFMETPLGLCPVDREVTGALSEEMDSITFNEHSLEVMIPFVQIKWPDAMIVPIVLGMEPDCRKVAELIYKHAPNAFLIASSDLSHFHPLKIAEKLDRKIIDAFLSLSPEQIGENLEACGKSAIKTLLYFAALKRADLAVELDYSTSADAGAGTDEVVGYFSGMVLK